MKNLSATTTNDHACVNRKCQMLNFYGIRIITIHEAHGIEEVEVIQKYNVLILGWVALDVTLEIAI